jgi:hypothetical protein
MHIICFLIILCLCVPQLVRGQAEPSCPSFRPLPKGTPARKEGLSMALLATVLEARNQHKAALNSNLLIVH